FVVIFDLCPVVAQHTQLLGELDIVGRDGATIAKRAQVLAGVETKCSGMGQGTGAAPFVARTMRLAGVFEDEEVVASRNLHYRVHRPRLTIKVTGDEGVRVGCDARLNRRGIEQVGLGISFHKHCRCSYPADGQHRGDEGIGHGDHLVAWPDVPGAQRQFQRTDARVDAHTLAGAAEARKFLLKCRNVLTQDEMPGIQDALDRGIYLGMYRDELSLEIEERDRHARILSYLLPGNTETTVPTRLPFELLTYEYDSGGLRSTSGRSFAARCGGPPPQSVAARTPPP